MQRKFETKTRGELFVERVVWNAAAGAALAVMVLVLLCSLRWLDQISPQPTSERSLEAPAQVARPAVSADLQSAEVAAVNRPSG